MPKNVALKHVVVSGGAKGLGIAMVRALLEADYTVSTFSRNSSSRIQALSGTFQNRLFFHTADINSSEELKLFVQAALDHNGSIYGVINNAAVAQEGILATLPEIEIQRMLNTNLAGTIRLTRLCLRDMIRTPGGRIINISSIIGTRGYNGLSVYSATKAGLDGFSRSLARELGRRQITVNAVAPGYMQSEMSAGLHDTQLKQIVRRTPLGRLATFDDVVPLVLFLLSDQAQMVSGQTILIDGGISC